MLITVTTLADEMFVFEVSPDIELSALKSLCAIEFHIPIAQVSLLLNGRPLDNDKKKLKEYKITDGEVLLMQRIQGEKGVVQNSSRPATAARNAPFIDFGSIAIPISSNSFTSLPQVVPSSSEFEDPSVLREILLNSPHDLALLRERNPPLAEALLSGDLARFTQVLTQQRRDRQQREQEKFKLLTSDPFDSEAQRRIAEEIRLKNVEHNMETAMEYAPESFGQVSMLYIDCMVNNHPVKAFVDSGAQTTIMSQSCAERCNIMRLADTRFTGVAKGVGVQQIIGKVHLCQLQIGSAFLQCSFCILKDQPMDMLLGLDMLKRHQCIINLMNNELIIGTSNIRTPFLGEADLPVHARLNRSPTEEDEQRQILDSIPKTQQDPKTAKAAKDSKALKDAKRVKDNKNKSKNNPEADQELPMEISDETPSEGTSCQFSEFSIQQIVDNNFSREQAVEELKKSKGNVDEALASLLAKFFQSS